MKIGHPVGARELDADGWSVGMTREQILAAAGISPELAAECERLAALSEAEFKAMLAQRTRIHAAGADWYWI
jgi:hypothetical protein